MAEVVRIATLISLPYWTIRLKQSASQSVGRHLYALTIVRLVPQSQPSSLLKGPLQPLSLIHNTEHFIWMNSNPNLLARADKQQQPAVNKYTCDVRRIYASYLKFLWQVAQGSVEALSTPSPNQFSMKTGTEWCCLSLKAFLVDPFLFTRCAQEWTLR